jgi:hypothetical protein
MPYSNIVFVKLFLSLFEEDDRFLYQLNESQQLLYIKMLYMAGSTNNNIPKNLKFICNKINYHHEEECFKSDIKRIKEVFPKFIENDHFYSFEKFEELHNYIGKSKGNPKEIQRMIPEKSKNKRRVRIREDKDKEEDKEASFVFLKEKLFLKNWGEYLEMRQKIRKPATDRAKEMVLTELHKHDLETAVKMLEQSILNSWQGVFPLKEKLGELTKAQKNNLSGLKKTMERISNDKSKLSTGLPCLDSGVPRTAI